MQLSVEELRDPQVVMTPELAAAGVHLEVLSAEFIAERLGYSEEMLDAFPDVRERLVPRDLLLAVFVEGADVEVVDARGERVALGGGVSGAVRWWTTERFPWRANGSEMAARPQEVTHLEVRVPVTFPSRGDDTMEALRAGVSDLCAEQADELLGQFVPCVRVVPEPVADNSQIPLGASRFNGLLERREPPVDHPFYGQQYALHAFPGYGAPARLTFEAAVSAPFDALRAEADRLGPLESTELEDLLYAAKAEHNFHQIGGWPNAVQEDLLGQPPYRVRELERSNPRGWSDVAEDGTPWVLVLQFLSDHSLEIMLGDVGSLYFMAPAADIARGHFTRTIVEFQCS